MPTQYPLVNLVKLPNGDLRIELRTDIDAKAEVQEIIEEVKNDKHDRGYDAALHEVLEYDTCNGWTFDTLDRLGALSEAPFLSEECGLGDNGQYENVGKIYYYNNYMLYDPLEEILNEGYVIFTGYTEK